MREQLKVEDNLSVLEEALSAYKNLIKTRYQIFLAHKNHEYLIELVFLARNFIHLSGINKLKDLSLLTNSKTLQFYRLCKDKILRDRVTRSIYFEHIKNRLYSIIYLSSVLTSVDIISYYKFIRKIEFNYTSIEFDYFAKGELYSDIYYYFMRSLDNSNSLNEHILVSTFIDNYKNYSIGQEQMTLLKLTVISEDVLKKRILFDRTNKM